MYLSAERLAIANRTVQETFEQTSIAWQAIPRWDTGDPGQARVRGDVVNNPDPNAALPALVSATVDFDVTLAQAIAPIPDSLLARVTAMTVELAAKVDDAVIPALRKAGTPDLPLNDATPDTVVGSLIDARVRVEKAGYRASSCLITTTAGLKVVSTLVSGVPGTEVLFGPPNINSLHRAEVVETTPPAKKFAQGILLGRRQRIPHGRAVDASPGEEPVDLAVSVFPSLEVVGDTTAGTIAVSVRIRYAVRIKDVGGIVALIKP
ncbi:hypothetical protein [Mycolicibacterium hodleri]|uniref:Uncharacterized protein n=1 Tax=Mycolicibacterium hodleri TaxID=49897 RepID=A0A502EDY0_9MYCO|nr:hypothetical protein [Mycolicibacterium hodleri]TPG34581.1 hypothetical protein EAH80_13755 [Mycolicibacterium hodleri]